MTEPENPRVAAVEPVARWMYEQRAPQSAPPWDEVGGMQRFGLLEAANRIVNEVLQHMVPTAPDHAALVMQMEILATELEQQTNLLWPGPAVAAQIRDAVRLASDYGQARTDGRRESK